MRTHGNATIAPDRVRAALLDLDAGATLMATGAKYGIAFTYLHTLKKNRQRRRDAQAGRK